MPIDTIEELREHLQWAIQVEEQFQPRRVAWAVLSASVDGRRVNDRPPQRS